MSNFWQSTKLETYVLETTIWVCCLTQSQGALGEKNTKANYGICPIHVGFKGASRVGHRWVEKKMKTHHEKNLLT